MSALVEGAHIELDPSVRTFRGGAVLTGGFPGRLIALSPEGVESLTRLTGGRPLSVGDRQLGRRLVAAGLAHPSRPEPLADDAAGRVTVVVPVRDRAPALDRCLGAIGRGSPVVVVDDGSDDPDAVAAVCRRHGARLVPLEHNAGPGAARNVALDLVTTELVALVDSDCRVTDGWLAALIPLFADPELGAVAPRVRPRILGHGCGRGVLARFAAARCPLDMGPDRAEVGPDRLVRYVPTAALVARRTALGTGFDPALRVGEDVDLVWRMGDAGWRVRFEPSVSVWHDEPTDWAAWLCRRFRYGTSAGPLARRHPERLAPVELRAVPTAMVAAGLAGRLGTAGALWSVSTALTFRGVRRYGIPLRVVLRWTAAGAGWTLVGLGRAGTTLAAPGLLLAATRRRRWALKIAALVFVPPLVEWRRRRPGLDPLRWSLCCIVDDLAYGFGVWAGAFTSHCLRPLLPGLRARQWAAPSDAVGPDVPASL